MEVGDKRERDELRLIRNGSMRQEGRGERGEALRKGFRVLEWCCVGEQSSFRV
jgi:hypothetical protein